MVSQQEGRGEPWVPSSPPQPLHEGWKVAGESPSKQGGEIRIELALRQRRRVGPGEKTPREEEWRNCLEEASGPPHQGRQGPRGSRGRFCNLVPAPPSEPRLCARPEAGAGHAHRLIWGRTRGKPRPQSARIGSARRRASPSHRPSLLPGPEPPVRRVGTALALSAARSAARQSGRRALGSGPTTQQQRSPDDTRGARARLPGHGTRSQPARVQPRSGGGEESGPVGDAVAVKRAGLEWVDAAGPRASRREVGTRPPPRRKRSGGGMRGGRGSSVGRDASSGACHVAYRPREATVGDRPAGGLRRAGLHRLDAARRPSTRCAWGALHPRRAAGPRSGRIWIPLAHAARAVRAARRDHARRPLHLVSVHLSCGF